MSKTKQTPKPAEGRVIDFTAVEVKDLSGRIEKLNISEALGNFVYKIAPDLGMFEAARLIYKEGKVTILPVSRPDHAGNMVITEPIKEGLLMALNDPRCPFAFIVKKSIMDMIDGKKEG